jgi:mono/diheme cytochrome c family protein
VLILLVGCTLRGVWEEPDPELERMIEQQRIDPYEDPAAPPAGAVPVPRASSPLAGPLLARGHDRYDAFCGPCHGPDGDARTPVARAMPVPPRDLLLPELRDHPERVMAAIAEGYGLMPSYADRVSGADAAAVVAWVGELQRVAAEPP